jgi:hypothetical protein
MANMNTAGITPVFKMMAIKNEAESKRQGRPIFDDWEMCELRVAGSKDFPCPPALSFSHWIVDEETGEQRAITYAERFAKQYQQFKSREQQTKTGTPLDYLPFLTEGKRAELRALSIYTAEALAELEGQSLKNLGLGGRELKNKAQEYLASSSQNAVLLQQQAKIEALQMQLDLLQSDKERAAGVVVGPREPAEDQRAPVKEDDEAPDEGDDSEDEEITADSGAHPDFVGMDRKQLRQFIAERTGKAPVGNPSTKTLVRMADAARARA